MGLIYLIYICIMEIKDRLRMVIQSHGLTAGEFADKIGVQRSNVSHILNGRNKPGFEFLEKVVSNFPRVQAHWLLTGVNKGEEKAAPVPLKQAEPEQPAKSDEKFVIRIVTFYSDNTFDIAVPNA